MIRTKRFVYSDTWTARALLRSIDANVCRLDYTTRTLNPLGRTPNSVGLCDNQFGVCFFDFKTTPTRNTVLLNEIAQSFDTPSLKHRTVISNFFNVTVNIDEIPSSWKTDFRTVRAFRFFYRLYCSRRPHLSQHNIFTFLANMDDNAREVLLRLYVEPYEEQNLLAQLTSVFMHSRQQGGLNAKHASMRPPHETDDVLGERADTVERSINDFDTKIYIEMSTSCVDRSLCEVMMRVEDLSLLAVERLASSFRAWRLYDCKTHHLLRVEFERSTGSDYAAELLAHARIQLFYTSDKNIFDNRDDFVLNFIRYYSFYFNYERPPSNENLDATMELRVCVIYFYARVNWKMLHRNKCLGNNNNSISINPQSLYKSNGNPIYAVFSENSIHRMVTQHRYESFVARGPYVGRGIGHVPQFGVNAIPYEMHFP